MKCQGVIELAIYGFLLMANGNILPNSARVREIRLWKPSDLDVDLSRSLKDKCDGVIGLPIHCFLLIVNSNKGLSRLLYEI